MKKHAPVRSIAARIVRAVSEGAAARTQLDRATNLDARGRALLTELVYGTVRHRDTLEHVLESASARGLEKVAPDVLAALLVAAYQLVFLEHVPAAVAVSEAVEGVRAPHLKRFANGLLRGVGRLVAGRIESDEPPANVPATRRLPGREKGWVLLAEDLLPDPEREAASWLALATAHPIGLVRRWLPRFGFERTLEVCRADNAPPPVCLRANCLKTTRDELVAALAAQEARPGHEAPEAVYLEHHGDPSKLAPFVEGRCTVQDETAMLVAPFVAPRPGAHILDLCAAPGGKTTHLAELMKDEGEVVASDADGSRLDRVKENVTRLGLRSVRVHEGALDAKEKFDAVLVDVPCSNTGVLRRRVEVRTRLDALERAPLLALQRDLLARALAHLRPGGVLVYSTCSIDEDENEGQVKAFLAANPGLRLDRERASLPRRGAGDGGYAAAMSSGPL